MGATLISALMLAGLIVATQAIAAIDPTAPPGTLGANKGGAQARAELAWVRINGKQSVAWYGGTVVRMGEAVENGRVVAIREDGIVIAGPAGRRMILLLDPAVRVSSSKYKR